MRYLTLITLLLLFVPGVAQEPDTGTIKDPVISLPQKRLPYLFGSVRFGALADGISTSKIVDFTSDDFLDNDEKDALLSQMNGSLRYGYFREIEFGYRAPSYRVFDRMKKGQGFRIRNRFYNSARLDENIVNLIFYGNKPYEDQELDLGKTGYETWYFTSLDYIFDVMLDSLQPMTVNVGIQVGHDHNNYKLRSGSLYTAPDGEYLDMQLDYSIQDKSGETLPLAGLGVGIGAETSFDLSNNSRLEFKVDDLGILYWNSGRLLETDSTFRFRGATFDNILDINDSLTDAAEDRYTEAFLYEEEEDYLKILPFYLSASYYLNFKGLVRSFFVQADYRYLAGFMPRLRTGVHLNTGFRQILTGSISTGGYNWFSLNAGYQFEMMDDWQVNLQIENLNGLLVPNLFGGAIGYLGVQYQL